jgi:hypothetical protein
MDKLKPFAVPLVAVILLLVWYFAVQPRLVDEPAPEAETKTQPGPRSDPR